MRKKKIFLQRAVIKEELVELTGSHRRALLLNQLIYWTERNRHIDEYLEEEAERQNLEILVAGKTEGWIYKTAKDWIEELMLDCSENTIRDDLKYLITNGWVEERRNPKVKYDRTLQYRLNLKVVQDDLKKLGYALESVKLNIEKAIRENDGSNRENRATNHENSTSKPDDHGTITYNTTKNTTENIADNTDVNGNPSGITSSVKDFPLEILLKEPGQLSPLELASGITYEMVDGILDEFMGQTFGSEWRKRNSIVRKLKWDIDNGKLDMKQLSNGSLKGVLKARVKRFEPMLNFYKDSSDIPYDDGRILPGILPIVSGNGKTEARCQCGEILRAGTRVCPACKKSVIWDIRDTYAQGGTI